MRVAVFPGTFDPITRGHESLVVRGLTLFDQVIIAVAHNPHKRPKFSLDLRVAQVTQIFQANAAVQVAVCETLVVEFAKQHQAQCILRGVRFGPEFDYECRMALVNRQLAPGIETVFLPAEQQYIHLSSSVVKDIAAFGGDLTGLVDDRVAAALLHNP